MFVAVLFVELARQLLGRLLDVLLPRPGQVELDERHIHAKRVLPVLRGVRRAGGLVVLLLPRPAVRMEDVDAGISSL